MTDKLWLHGFNVVLMEQLINSTISFIKSQTSYCPVICMFCSRTSMNKLNDIRKNCLFLVRKDYDSNFNELLESSHGISLHKTCITYLILEVLKYLHGLSPELMTEICTLCKNPCNMNNIFLLYSYKYICNTNNL